MGFVGMENSKSPVASRRLLAVLKEKGNDVTSNDDAATNNSTNAAEVVLLSGKNTHRPNPTAGKLRAQERAEASHERLADPPGGIPGAGGVVGKAEIPGGWLTAK